MKKFAFNGRMLGVLLVSAVPFVCCADTKDDSKEDKSWWDKFVDVIFFKASATPEGSKDDYISPDVPVGGGLTSRDVRTVAHQMAPSILAVQEIAKSDTVKRVKISEFKNSSRFFFSHEMFLKRLTVELNRYGRNKLRFINDRKVVAEDREKILLANQSRQVQKSIEKIAGEIAALSVAQQEKPITVGVLPVLNINLVNMNGESFLAMVRSEVSRASKGKVQILLPGAPMTNADYYLAGQFIPETIKQEGIINLANYIEVVDARVKDGRSMYIATTEKSEVIPGQVTSVVHNDQVTSTTVTATEQVKNVTYYEDHIKKLLDNPDLRAVPDMNKRLNVILANAKTKASIYEGMCLIDCKVTDASGYADYIISGEISGLEETGNDKTSADYLMITMQLTAVETGDIVWEDIYEVKRKSTNAAANKNAN